MNVESSRVWYPNTQMSEWDDRPTIESARGVWLIDSKGNKMIDGVASMWCNVWGHSNSRLIKAITNQVNHLQHTSMFNLTNKPAEELAHRLISISPGMDRVFYSDNGSSSMEIAIKMILQYWKNQNVKRTKIGVLENGYHGDTFGAMSIGYVPEFFDAFRDQLFDTIKFPVPNTYRIPESYTLQDYQNYCLDQIEDQLSTGKFAGFVMESGAQVAGGVIIYPDKFQSEIARICKRHNVLFALDEVATGFGRLGSMVQYTAQNSQPDIVSYGKMLTAGYLSMAATLATKSLYDEFLGEFDQKRHLFHGHTYTGNPIAASVANENLSMYDDYQLVYTLRSLSEIFASYRDTLCEINLVGDVRHKGMLMGIELVSDRTKKTPLSAKQSINKIIFKEGQQHGVYLRTLDNIVTVVPPLAITSQELHILLDRVVETIKSTSKHYA